MLNRYYTALMNNFVAIFAAYTERFAVRGGNATPMCKSFQVASTASDITQQL